MSAETSKRRTTHPRRAARQDAARLRAIEAQASGRTPIEREHLRGYHSRCHEQWGISAPCSGWVAS